MQRWIPHRLYRHTRACRRALHLSSSSRSQQQGRYSRGPAGQQQWDGGNSQMRRFWGPEHSWDAWIGPSTISSLKLNVKVGQGEYGGVFIIRPRLRMHLEDAPPCSWHSEENSEDNKVSLELAVKTQTWFSTLVVFLCIINSRHKYFIFCRVLCKPCWYRFVATQQDTSRSPMRTRDLTCSVL